jgi:nucleoside-diphosphate-sugar epimerase
MRCVSIVGCGYTGVRLARRCREEGGTVRGYATRPASLTAIAAVGADPALLDLDSSAAQAPPQVEGHVVYYCVPPSQTSDADVRLKRFLSLMQGRPLRIVYLSTTGVYGDHAGGRVDEDTPTHAETARAVRRVAAERSITAFAADRSISWCILRVAGIYGPNRLPLERLRRREPAIEPAEARPTNRIHVDDLVTACVAAGRVAGADRRIYNVTDGNEESSTEFLQRVARLTGLPPPPLMSRAMAREVSTPSVWSFLGESRRVDNRRMLTELGVTLAYHDLDMGIRASLEEQDRLAAAP